MHLNWTPEKLRAFEDDIKETYLSGVIHGPIHLSGGEGCEEPLLEIFQEVRPTDWVCSTHRSHYHALLKGVPPEKVKAEILAGHSIHLNFKEHNFITSAIVGGIIPIALGLALAIKRKGEDRKVWCFLGDMAARMGIAYEAINYARNFDLPLNVVIEENGFSTNTPTWEAWGFKAITPRGMLPQGEIITLEEWDKGKVVIFLYERRFPHVGCGQWVQFMS